MVRAVTQRSGFSLDESIVALPQGAWARTHRRTLRHDGKPILCLTQGRQRAYVFPLYTPAGFGVTSESPGDHPHHNSFWIAADHVHARMPIADGKHEDYTYNFYVDETFQGRAPGRIVALDSRCETLDSKRARIIQDIEWRGPVEWAAPEGRIVAREQREMLIATQSDTHVIDVTSRLRAAEWDFTIGPTRHAYFNVRVADSMTVDFGGTVRDDRGREGGEAITGTGSRWVDFSGPVGGDNRAGLAVFPHPRDHAELSWFVTDWGVVTVGPFRLNGRLVRRGEEMIARYRVLAHDGELELADLRQRFNDYVNTSDA
jgi:Methane oxygenase PmoA